MLFRHLSAAHGVALYAGLVNERRSVAAHGALECAACRGQVERLIFASLFVHLMHSRRYRLGVILCKLEHGAGYCAVDLRKAALTVAEAAVLVFHLAQRLIGEVVHDDRLHNILHLAAVSARIHQNAAADGARDAACKLKTGKSVRLRKLRKPCKRYARFGVDGVVRCAQTQLRELLGANDADIKPLLGDYEVRALADDERQHLVHVQVVKYLRHFPNVLGHDERSDLAADLERAVCSHALMLAQVELGYVFYYAAEGLF